VENKITLLDETFSFNKKRAKYLALDLSTYKIESINNDDLQTGFVSNANIKAKKVICDGSYFSEKDFFGGMIDFSIYLHKNEYFLLINEKNYSFEANKIVFMYEEKLFTVIFRVLINGNNVINYQYLKSFFRGLFEDAILPESSHPLIYSVQLVKKINEGLDLPVWP